MRETRRRRSAPAIYTCRLPLFRKLLFKAETFDIKGFPAFVVDSEAVPFPFELPLNEAASEEGTFKWLSRRKPYLTPPPF
jgi:hypothetical protein